MIELLPWTAFSRVEPLLATSGHAEGLPGWYAALAETTLAADEVPAFAIAGTNAVLPVANGRFGLRALTAPYTTQYVPYVPDVTLAYKLGRELSQFAGGRLALDGLNGADPAIAQLVQGLRCGMAVASFEGFANWSEPVATFTSYWQRRPSKLRSTVRRKSAAPSTFHYFPRGSAAVLADYEAVRASSWKGPEPHPAFLASLVRHLEPIVRMGLLEIDGQVAAAQIWLVHGGRATIFKLVHRADAVAQSPGTVLTRAMIERCMAEDRVTLLDFGRGDDGYKRDWMGVRTTRLGVIAGDWHHLRGLRSIATEILPTWAGARWRHLTKKRDGSVAAPEIEVLADGVGEGTVRSADVQL